MADLQFLGEVNKVHSAAYSLDLQRAIISQNKKAAKQVQRFAIKHFGRYRHNKKLLAFKVWQFMKQNFVYKKDSPNAQKIFLPSAAWHYRRKGFDCKSFATFAGAIFTSLGIPNGFYFTNYNGQKYPSHIYNWLRLDNGNILPVDGCAKRFAPEKRPTLRKTVILAA